MQLDKLICKIIIKNGASKTCSITGEIDEGQLKSKENEWITVENAVFGNNKFKFIDMAIYKADIEKIIVFQPKEEITFNEEDFRVNETFQFL